jgi:hypothetical protein
MSRGMTRMGLEVASAYRYIDAQDDFGPMTKNVLKGIVRSVAEAAISDVEDFVAEQRRSPESDEA